MNDLKNGIQQMIQESKTIPTNTAYHAGNLGKSENWSQQVGSSRGSGHFGTGTWFVGHHNEIKGYNDNNYGYGIAPHWKIDMNKVQNMYKPKTDRDAYNLDRYLKVFNNKWQTYNTALNLEPWRKKAIQDIIENRGDFSLDDEDAPDYELNKTNRLKAFNDIINSENEGYAEPRYKNVENYDDMFDVYNEMNPYYGSLSGDLRWYDEDVIRYQDKYKNLVNDLANNLGRTPDEIRNAIEKVREAYKFMETVPWNKQQEYDSPSTIFMKALGYNGVDVRHLRNWDNTGRGSVIYDLDKAFAQEVKPGVEYDVEYDD